MGRSRWLWTAAVVAILVGGIYAVVLIRQGGSGQEYRAQVGNPDFDPAAYSSRKEIYPDPSQATADVTKAIKEAKRENKRVILDFGGNWCPDCHVLDIYFHDAANRPLLDRYFILVHINVGSFDENLDLAAKYNIPLQKGVPALAVLDSRGKLLYSQHNGQFEAMRRMESSSVTSFLNKWKP